MKTLIALEEAALFALAAYLFSLLGHSWWWFFGLLLAPDVSMVGYLAGNRVGAWCYNLFHHTGVAVLVYLAGIYTGSDSIKVAGLILLAHSRMDRLLGYGLKYENGFKFTHLGNIGKQ